MAFIKFILGLTVIVFRVQVNFFAGITFG